MLIPNAKYFFNGIRECYVRFLDLCLLDIFSVVPYRTVRPETDQSCHTLPIAFTDPRPTVPSVPCQHDIRGVAVCMQRTGRQKILYSFITKNPTWRWLFTDPRICRKHGIHLSIRIRHGADYLLNPDYAEKHGIHLVIRIQHGADYLRIRDYGSGLPTDRDRRRAKRYTSRYVLLQSTKCCTEYYD